jgi:sulfur transfer complex TusBCD TusB component (DsrH family)
LQCNESCPVYESGVEETCTHLQQKEYNILLYNSKLNSLGVITVCNSMSTNVSENSTASIFNATEDILATGKTNIISNFIAVRISNFKRLKFGLSLRLKRYAQGQSVHDVCRILKVTSMLNKKQNEKCSQQIPN